MSSSKKFFTLVLIAGAVLWQMSTDPSGLASFIQIRQGMPFISTAYLGGNPVREISAVQTKKWNVEAPVKKIFEEKKESFLHKRMTQLGGSPSQINTNQVSSQTRCSAQYSKDFDAMLASSVQANDLECIQHAVNEGAQIIYRDANGDSLLHIASRSGNLELARFLIEKGMDVGIQANDKSTPLHWAAQAGNLAMAQLLLRDGGAQPNVLNHEQLTPLDLATNYQVGGESPMVSLLTEFGALHGAEIGGVAPNKNIAPPVAAVVQQAGPQRGFVPAQNQGNSNTAQMNQSLEQFQDNNQDLSRPEPAQANQDQQDAIQQVFPLPEGNNGEMVDQG